MNRNSNLQRSVKKAFEEHTEPLREAQWDRLSAALGNQPRKRRIFPWLFGLALVAALSLGIGYWLGSDAVNNTNALAAGQQDHSGADRSRTSESNTASPAVKESPISANERQTENIKIREQGLSESNDALRKHKDKFAENEVRSEKSAKAGTQKSRRHKPSPYMPNEAQKEDGSRENNDAGMSEKSNQNGAAGTIASAGTPAEAVVEIRLLKRPLLKLFNAKTYGREEVTELFADKFVPGTTKKQGGKDGGDVPEFTRFAVGFSTGFSHVVYKDAVFSDPDKMHRDTRTLYKEENSQTKSSFANLFFDVKVLKRVNLTFHSGVQYRQLQTTENIAYKYNNIPFRDTNGGIIGYLFVSDTLHPEIFRNNSIRTTRFVSVPLCLGYTMSIGSRNELQLNGGVIFNKLTTAKGSTFSLNDQEFADIRNRYSRKLTLGYAAGLSFYRNIYDAWWIGVGLQMQQNRTVFETQYGTIGSNINITNYTFNIKYKF